MDPTLKYGLIGAGAGTGLGAAANLLVGDKKKDKVKQALKGIMIGGALGGAAGAGLGYFRDSVGLDFMKDKNTENKNTEPVVKENQKQLKPTAEESPIGKAQIENLNKLSETHKELANEMATDSDFVNHISKYKWDEKELKDLKYDQEKQWYDIWESDEEKLLRSKAGQAYLKWRAAGKTAKDLAEAYKYLHG